MSFTPGARHMPRPLACILLFCGIALGVANPVVAEPPNPLDLIRGLRDNGMPDLALEFLDEISKDKEITGVKAVLPLERGNIRLTMAEEALDDSTREMFISEARSDLQRFLKQNPGHPRLVEGQIALARATALQAQGILTRANQIDDDDEYKKAAVKARKPYLDAAKSFQQAAKEIESRLKSQDTKLNPREQKSLQQEMMDAELEAAISKYQISRTFVRPDAKETLERAKLINQAKDDFMEIGKKYPNSPNAYIAKAWAGQCELSMDTPKAAEKLFTDVKRARTQAAMPGIRMARYFEANVKFEDAIGKPSPQTVNQARQALSSWLRDYGRGKPTPETFAVKFRSAFLNFKDVQKNIKVDEETKKPIVPPALVSQLKTIERQFRDLTLTDNDYTARATRERTRVIRLIVGDADKDPAKIRDFEEAVMAAMVQFDNVSKSERPETDEEKKAYRDKLDKVVALLERASTLPAPRDSAREQLENQIRLAYAYLIADRPYQAAILGEHIARSSRLAGPASRGGDYAIKAYLAASRRVPAEDVATVRADRGKAIEVARFLDTTFPGDPATDYARAELGRLLAQDRKYSEAFDALSRVTVGYSQVAYVRIMQLTAAFELLRDMTEEGKLNADGLKIYKQLVADVKAVPQPDADALANVVEPYCRMGVLLAQAHLLAGTAGYPEAEKQANELIKTIAGFNQLPDEDKQVYTYQAEETRLRSIFAQIVPQFRDEKFDAVEKRLSPEIEKIIKDGPATKDGQEDDLERAANRLDEYRREKILVYALQTQIRLKNIEKASQLFDQLKKLGGDLDNSIQALNQLLAVIRPQIDALKAEEKEEDAQALIDGLSRLLDKVAAEPNLTPRVQMFLGRGLKDIGALDNALEVLEKIPAPEEELLKKNPNQIEDNDDRVNVLMYRGSRLDLVRVHRMLKQYDEAQEVLKAAMGTEEEPGYAKNAPDFRKEALYLMEARAADTEDKQEASKLWGEARAGWDTIANEYRGVMMKPMPAQPKRPEEPAEDATPQQRQQYEEAMAEYQEIDKKRNDVLRLREQVKPLYFETMYESLRCLSTANDQLLADNPDRQRELMGKIAEMIRRVEDSNPDLEPETLTKFHSLRQKFPLIDEEYAKIPPAEKEPMAEEGVAQGTPDPDSAENDKGEEVASDTEKAKDKESEIVAEEDSTVSLILGGLAGIATIVFAGYFVKTSLKRPAAPRKYGSHANKDKQPTDDKPDAKSAKAEIDSDDKPKVKAVPAKAKTRPVNKDKVIEAEDA